MRYEGNTRELAHGILIAAAVATAVFVLFVDMARYTALVFCAVLVAVALTALARVLTFHGRLPHGIALALAMILLVLCFTGLGAWTGPQLVDQFDALAEQVPKGLEAARRWFASSALGGKLVSEAPSFGEMLPSSRSLVGAARRGVSAGFSAAGETAAAVALGVFLAASPERYREGALRLLPPRRRERAREVIAAMAAALRRWLLARGALMLLVGTLLGIGLFALSIPFALPLAVLAGLLAFIPYVGPLLAFVPAVAVGLLKSPTHGLYVAVLYLGVQLVESYVAEPVIEARAISLPPGLIIIAQIVAAVWLGTIGILLATPLLVVTVVAVQMLYLQDILDEDAPVIGSQ